MSDDISDVSSFHNIFPAAPSSEDSHGSGNAGYFIRGGYKKKSTAKKKVNLELSDEALEYLQLLETEEIDSDEEE